MESSGIYSMDEVDVADFEAVLNVSIEWKKRNENKRDTQGV